MGFGANIDAGNGPVERNEIYSIVVHTEDGGSSSVSAEHVVPDGDSRDHIDRLTADLTGGRAWESLSPLARARFSAKAYVAVTFGLIGPPADAPDRSKSAKLLRDLIDEDDSALFELRNLGVAHDEAYFPEHVRSGEGSSGVKRVVVSKVVRGPQD